MPFGKKKQLPAIERRLVETLRPLMVRHTKKDLQLPEPITLLPFDGVLEKSTREYCSWIQPACTQFFPPWTTKGMKNFGRCFW